LTKMWQLLVIDTVSTVGFHTHFLSRRQKLGNDSCHGHHYEKINWN